MDIWITKEVVVQELLKIRDRIQDDYEHAVNTGDTYLEADGLLAALRLIDERIEQICEEKGI